MANTNLNNNTNTARRSVSPFPTADLTFKWLGAFDGNDLLNVLGANPTYVSGTGLDAIYDFSVLNDDRFDKGAIVGNALGLPEYYNSPLNAYFYYDATSETTRRYWKLKDFHYFYLQQQTDITPQLLNNWCFLKATATTDTSNEIDTIQSLHIYSTEQITTLPKLRGLIGATTQLAQTGDNYLITDQLSTGSNDLTFYFEGNMGSLTSNYSSLLVLSNTSNLSGGGNKDYTGILTSKVKVYPNIGDGTDGDFTVLSADYRTKYVKLIAVFKGADYGKLYKKESTDANYVFVGEIATVTINPFQTGYIGIGKLAALINSCFYRECKLYHEAITDPDNIDIYTPDHEYLFQNGDETKVPDSKGNKDMNWNGTAKYIYYYKS